MHDLEVTGYELISKDGEIHYNVCYGCYEEKITELRETQDIEYEYPIYYSDGDKSVSTCEICKDKIDQTSTKP